MFFHCLFRKKSLAQADARPLSECCGCSRVRVCRISGDRSVCGRMASLGVLPGTVLETLCSGRRRQCMVKINGCTLSLDGRTAESIFVQSL